VLKDSICSRLTTQQLQECLEGVVLEGTGKTLRSHHYRIAGKTGTALVANGNRGYADKIYQSSFAGYFPADNPQYSIIVVIKNKPHAANFYGASVAGPVFKEIADQIFRLKVSRNNNVLKQLQRNDSGWYNYSAYTKDIQKVTEELGVKVSKAVSNGRSNYSRVYKQGAESMISTQVISSKQMPSLIGMGLKDAVYLCENLGLKVVVRGKGKVVAQTLAAGQNILKRQTIIIQFN
jgi:cell division protein FtsI (penicillin-binding protein 3)